MTLLVGTSFGDVIFGTLGDDIIRGKDGNDILHGGGSWFWKPLDISDGHYVFGGGNDALFGGDGRDKLDGGDGRDRLHGGRGRDKLDGGRGGDDLFGGGGRDMLKGGAGNDAIDGGGGNDSLVGGRGADWLFGGLGDDRINGGSGRDTLDGGAGNDQVQGGRGNDQAIFTMAENVGARDDYRGGVGVDTLTLDLTRDEWFQADLQADIAAFLRFIEDHTNSKSGQADGAVFKFSAFNLKARQFEDLRIFVDGVELDPADEPVKAVDDAVAVNEDANETVFGSVLVNDAVPDLAYSLSLVSNPAEGLLVFNQDTRGTPDGSFSFDPNGAFEDLAKGESRSVSFVYEVTDANGDTDQATVEIMVQGANDAPVAAADHGTTDEDTVVIASAPGLLANDSDVDASDVLTIAGFDPVSALGAAISVNADGGVAYDPTVSAALQDLAAGECVQDTFSYTISDGNGGTDTATVTVTVQGLNEPVLTPAQVLLSAGSDVGITTYGNFTHPWLVNEPYTVQQSLESFGYDTEFTSTKAASGMAAFLADKEALVIAEAEYGAIPEGIAGAVADFVNGGGTLVVMSSASGREAEFLNTAFGYELVADNAGTMFDASVQTGDVANTLFADNATMLSGNFAIWKGLDTGSLDPLPTDAFVFYASTAESDVGNVVSWTQGEGQITYLAYDWFAAEPAGFQDGGWVDVLHDALSEPELLIV